MAEVTPLPDSVSQAGSSVPSEGNSAEKQDIDVVRAQTLTQTRRTSPQKQMR